MLHNVFFRKPARKHNPAQWIRLENVCAEPFVQEHCAAQCFAQCFLNSVRTMFEQRGRCALCLLSE